MFQQEGNLITCFMGKRDSLNTIRGVLMAGNNGASFKQSRGLGAVVEKRKYPPSLDIVAQDIPGTTYPTAVAHT